jgi:two-component system, chemotaxis family, protein-glutamate methylesterase/glutaminase
VNRDIIMIGASAGGFEAIRSFVSRLPQNLPASVFVTLHTAPAAPGLLAELLASAGPLPVISPKNPIKIRPGHVYVSQPNLHLIVKRGFVASKFLPKENGTRPAIDPMFRSAAHSYARRVIGILLTGNLDDGAAGLRVIKDEGGLAIVQEPQGAMYPGMPLAAIKSTSPDYIVPLSEIPPLIVDLVASEINALSEEPEAREIGHTLTCPGCRGVLTRYGNDRIRRYQESLWRMLSFVKEKEVAVQTMAADARESKLASPEYYERQLEATRQAQEQLGNILDELGPVLFPGTQEVATAKESETEEN